MCCTRDNQMRIMCVASVWHAIRSDNGGTRGLSRDAARRRCLCVEVFYFSSLSAPLYDARALSLARGAVVGHRQVRADAEEPQPSRSRPQASPRPATHTATLHLHTTCHAGRKRRVGIIKHTSGRPPTPRRRAHRSQHHCPIATKALQAAGQLARIRRPAGAEAAEQSVLIPI